MASLLAVQHERGETVVQVWFSTIIKSVSEQACLLQAGMGNKEGLIAIFPLSLSEIRLWRKSPPKRNVILMMLAPPSFKVR